jgi:hypothetical protein
MAWFLCGRPNSHYQNSPAGRTRHPLVYCPVLSSSTASRKDRTPARPTDWPGTVPLSRSARPSRPGAATQKGRTRIAGGETHEPTRKRL